MKKIIFAIFIAVFLIPVYSYGDDAHRLTIFHSLSCNHCVKVKNEVMPEIEKEFKGALEIAYRDIADIENYKMLIALRQRHNLPEKFQVPLFYLDGRFLTVDLSNKEGLRKAIIQVLAEKITAAQDNPAPVDLSARFKSFTPLAVTLSGLVDGINPCAFTVIVFFISFLALQGYRRRELAAIGLAFIFAVFLTYLLIGLGLFSFFYRLQSFWLLTKIFNLAVGVFSIIFGGLAVYDFIKFKKTRETEGLLLQLPQLVKNRIHSVIGAHYRKGRNVEDGQRRHIAGLIVSALVTGFLVSILEAVCTGQTYLPTISFILKAAPMNLQALAYLLWYNFMFIVPLLAIFVLALAGVTSAQFSAFLKRHLLTVKVLMAILFFGLGAFLLWRA